MIITCPNCETKFEVPETALGSAGRKLKCAKCHHVWFQSPLPPAAPEAPAVEPSEVASGGLSGSVTGDAAGGVTGHQAASEPGSEADGLSSGTASWQALARDRAALDPPASQEFSPRTSSGNTASDAGSRYSARTATLSAPFDGGRVPANGTAVSGPDDLLSFSGADDEPTPLPSGHDDLSQVPAGTVDGFAEFDSLQTPEDLSGVSDFGDGDGDTYDPFGNDPLLSSSPDPDPDVPGPRPPAGSGEVEDSFFSHPDTLETDGPSSALPVFESGPWEDDAGFSQQGDDGRGPFFGPVDGDPEPEPDLESEPEPEPEVQVPATPLDRALARLDQALDQAEGVSGPLLSDPRTRPGARPAPTAADSAVHDGDAPAAEGRLPKISSGPVPSRSVRGRRVLEVLAAILIVVNVACIAFLLLRDPIAHMIPETARVYALLGVPLSAVDDRLIFQNTVEENSPPGVQPRFLTVRGFLHNPSETTPLPVDGILLQVFGADDTMLQWVRGEVSRKVLQPGESIEFEITMLNLSELAYSYRLSLAQGR